jgi:hypothetical protein
MISKEEMAAEIVAAVNKLNSLLEIAKNNNIEVRMLTPTLESEKIWGVKVSETLKDEKF